MRTSLVASQPGSGRKVPAWEWILDLISFVAVVAWSVATGLRAGDLIWGLWICSLCFGSALLVAAIVAGVYRAEGTARVGAAMGGLFALGFFALHFGFFHFIHSVFLNQFFPLVPNARPPEFSAFMRTIAVAFDSFWPIVLATFVARGSELAIATTEQRTTQPGHSSIGQGVGRAYLGVIRMHMLIIVVLGPLHMAGLDQLAVYPVLALYFLPWRILFGLMSARQSEPDAEEL